MKFVQRDIPEGINVTDTHPLKDLLVLSGGLFFIILAIYFVLGFAADRIVSKMSPSGERKLSSLTSSMFPKSLTDSAAEKKLQEIVDRLTANLPEKNYDYRVHISCDDEINAFALPGGEIRVFKGLLRKVKSENELAMILGHEIGHFQNRDHLRGLGRGIVFLMIASGVGIANTSGGFSQTILSFAIDLTQKRFSQKQETAADLVGAELVASEYGHGGGITSFFETLAKEKPQSKISAWFSTHPHSKARAEKLQTLMEERGWKQRKLIPLAESVKVANVCSKEK